MEQLLERNGIYIVFDIDAIFMKTVACKNNDVADFYYVSGDKDSTVFLDLARRVYDDIPAIFIDTGLEYPKLREFVEIIDNAIWLKPKLRFYEVINKLYIPSYTIIVFIKLNVERYWTL